MLRKVSLIITFAGLSVLLGMLILPAEEIVGERAGLTEREINEKVVFSGKVESEKNFGDFKIWELSEVDFDVVCDCKESYLGEEIEIEGIVGEFNGQRQVRVLRIFEKK
jgi:hypothetical protein